MDLDVYATQLIHDSPRPLHVFTHFWQGQQPNAAWCASVRGDGFMIARRMGRVEGNEAWKTHSPFKSSIGTGKDFL